MKNRLALLIPTYDGREIYYNRLMDCLNPQLEKYGNDVGIITIKGKSAINGGLTTGHKRNILTELAIEKGYTHRAFIDCDDTVTDDYLDLNMPGVYGNFDCNTLIGIYSVNGAINRHKHIFLHSLKYDHWYEDETHYYRNPNHLNVIKLDLIKDIKFQDKTWGEDGCWSEDLAKADVLKNEYEITKPFYNYLSRTKEDGI